MVFNYVEKSIESEESFLIQTLPQKIGVRFSKFTHFLVLPAHISLPIFDLILQKVCTILRQTKELTQVLWLRIQRRKTFQSHENHLHLKTRILAQAKKAVSFFGQFFTLQVKNEGNFENFLRSGYFPFFFEKMLSTPSTIKDNKEKR